MDLKDFKAGKYIQQRSFKSFIPEPVNHAWTLTDPEIQQLLEHANAAINALNSVSELLPATEAFVRLHIFTEATFSSKIEGTHTSVEEAVYDNDFSDPESGNDWQEVQNYVKALHHSIKLLKNIPLSSRLIKECHGQLMKGARGAHKSPGEYRRSQNWIGGPTIQQATFIPPPHEELSALMGDLEKFLHNEKILIPHLVRIGIAHYQFETIHPFLDGNGRVGRLLIILYLMESNILQKPTLYFSQFIEKNRMEYYERLHKARTDHDLSGWIRFFLYAIKESAQASRQNLLDSLELDKKLCEKITKHLGRRAALAQELLLHLYGHPVINADDVVQKLNVTKPTAYVLLEEFLKLNILKERTGFKRNRIFVFEKFLKGFENGE